jgi:nitroreductase
MSLLNLTSDELLTTTRSVRKRLDFSRPVEPEVIRECLKIALQAPTGSNAQHWHFIVVTDPEKRQALGDIYMRAWTIYRQNADATIAKRYANNPQRIQTQKRIVDSSTYLAEHMGNVPVHLIPCITGRLEGSPTVGQAGSWGSILPATWSFMLAARARGLGSAWTTLHLMFEQEAAEVLGIPYEKITQAALIPVAYTQGTDFKPAPREPLDSVLHWNEW